MRKYKIIAFCGSLRNKSFNKDLLNAFIFASTEKFDIQIVEIGNLPLYNQDLETQFPESATNLKNLIKAADAVLFVTPEYNRSVPGVLKNAIDWVSRPYGDNALNNKPTAITGASIGNIGTAVSQSHLRQILSYLNTHTMGQPEFYLGDAIHKFDEQGNLSDQATSDFLQKFIDAFYKHIELFTKF